MHDAGAFQSSLERTTAEHGGILRCGVCGTEAAVRARYWNEGWPKCCTYTMTWITDRQLREAEPPSSSPGTPRR